jgi:hypothetical protein
MQPPFAADEPHYALEAFSIARDGDVDLANDYADIARVRAATDGQTTTLQPHAYRYTPGGPLSSMHHVGLPLLLAPAARVSMTVGALQLEMVLIAAIGAQLLFLILAKLLPGHRRWTWLSWAVVVFSLPLVGYSSRLYPELPAAVLVLGTILILLSERLRAWQLALAGALIAYLPWLHVRFGLIAAGLLVAVAARLLEQRGVIGTRRALVGAAIVGGLMAASLGLMAVEFDRWYGTPSLTAQLHTTNTVAGITATGAITGGNAEASPLGISASRALPGAARALFSARNGWLPFIPVGILAVAGAVALAVRARWWVALGLLTVLAYVLEIASTGVLPAYALPGRYEMVFLPLVAIPLALVLVQVRWTRWLFWPLAVVGAVITLFGMTHANGLVPFTPGDARADIGAANVLLRPWPVVSREPEVVVSPSVVAGREATVDTRAWRSGQRRLPATEYAVAVSLARTPASAAADAPAARIDIVSGDQVVARQHVPVSAIPVGEPRVFIRLISLGRDAPVGVVVQPTGRVGLRVLPVQIRASIDPLSGLGATGSAWPDLGGIVVWVLVLGALAVAIAVALPPTGSPARSVHARRPWVASPR